MAKKKDESEGLTKSLFVRCRFCGQKNGVKEGYKNGDANCGKCRLPLSNEPHKKFADLSKHDYELEPNVTFTPDNKWLVFRSNMHGSTHTYAVEVAKPD